MGSGCEEVYSAARITVHLGQPGGLGSYTEPFEQAWKSVVGSEASGPDLALAASPHLLLVGAPGRAAVLAVDLAGRTDATAAQLVMLPVLEDEDSDSALGTAVLRQDMDGDGQAELIASAPGASGVGESVAAGRLYLTQLDGPRWGAGQDSGSALWPTTADALLTGLGAASYDRLGSTVAGCGDLDGDGIGEIAVAAPWDDRGGASLGGAVRILSSRAIRAAREQAEPAPLSSLGISYASSQLGASAGAALHCGADLDGDGVPELAVGAPFADGDGESRGAIYLLSGAVIGAALQQPRDAELDQAYDLEAAAALVLYGPEDEAYLGSSLAIGDVDGDGRPDLLGGAPGGEGGRGLALLWADLELTREEPSATLGFRGESAESRFGSTVLLADISCDGFADLLVGAPRHNPSGSEAHYAAGAAYVWYGETSIRTWNPTTSAGKADSTLSREQAWLTTGGHMAAGDLDADGCADLALVHRIEPE